MSSDVDRDRARTRRVWLRDRLLEGLAETYGLTCCRCPHLVDLGREWPDPWGPSIDHLIALTDGGIDHFTNLRLAHLKCNREHGTRLANARSAAYRARRAGLSRWRSVAGQGELDLGLPSRRSFLVAAPAALIAAKLLPRQAPPPPARLIPGSPLYRWAHGQPVVAPAALIAAVVTIPDPLLEDRTINLWNWARPRMAEALARAA
jgi:hypothetical protein